MENQSLYECFIFYCLDFCLFSMVVKKMKRFFVRSHSRFFVNRPYISFGCVKFWDLTHSPGINLLLPLKILPQSILMPMSLIDNQVLNQLALHIRFLQSSNVRMLNVFQKCIRLARGYFRRKVRWYHGLVFGRFGVVMRNCRVLFWCSHVVVLVVLRVLPGTA